MNRIANWAAIACLLVALASCRRAPTPVAPAPVKAAPSATKPAPVHSDPSGTHRSEDSADATEAAEGKTTTIDENVPAEAASAEDAAAQRDDAVETSIVTTAARPTSDPPPSEDLASRVPAERIMLLTPAGPLLVDLHITIGGMPHQNRFDQVVADVMTIADDDQDGIVAWPELMNHPRFRFGQFGNPATSTYQAQQDMIRLYDTTKNDRVDSDELVRYLTSNRGTAQAMALYTSNYRRTQNRDASPIRKWLDINDDLVLDEAEIATAAARLRLRDNDDDEILTPADFVSATMDQTGMRVRRPRDSEFLPKVGWRVNEHEPWSDIRVAWNHYYSVGSSLQAEDLALGDTLFREMDVDVSNSLDNIEMQMLMEVDAHLSIHVELVPRGGGTPEIELTALRLPVDKVDSVVQHQPNRISIQLPGTALDIFARDTIGNARYGEQAQNYLRQADADENNYLSEDEFDAVSGFLNLEFEAADLDHNGKLLQDEIVTILEQRNMVNRHQVRLRADDQDDALLPTLDLNSDGRIDSRELNQVDETLRSLDQNSDGQIHLHELRGTMMVGVIRGGSGMVLQPNDASFQVPSVVREPSESAPRWFTGMDRNRDASISWREFLGSRQQFEDLDGNSDGFLILDEALAE